MGELSQVQKHRLGSEAHDGERAGDDLGETAARVATHQPEVDTPALAAP